MEYSNFSVGELHKKRYRSRVKSPKIGNRYIDLFISVLA
jgi:hypothetical protein